MVSSTELVQLAPALLIWQAHDSRIKSDLFSSAIRTKDGVYLVDPILLKGDPLSGLLNSGSICGIILTNANHLRAAPQFAAQLSVPIFARPESQPNTPGLDCRNVGEGNEICDELRVVEIEGAAPGEIVLYHTSNGGTLIVGDALINFEPYGFTFLPAKYCSDQKKMRRSLRKLLEHQFERMLFAHGTPILSGAAERLRQLLDVDLE